jgi:hypothetical protein
MFVQTVSTTTSKLSDLNEQYDLTGKVKTAAGLAVSRTETYKLWDQSERMIDSIPRRKRMIRP